ncbi:DivIVA domain-containing protein [Micromonospora trifolii]|uniref:DivIVA domain-containing protein n=1 Tax=Micromonospora trifolii TaxID=2911208 RepID=UPI003D2F278B
MAKPVKTAAALFGLGVGVAVGSAFGPVAVWLGVAVAAVGIGLSLIGTAESDLVGDGLVDRDEPAGVTSDATVVGRAGVAERKRRNANRPTFANLGTRVEQILKLAEEQADDHLNAARLEADKTVSAARQEAEAILRRARDQAAGNTG